MASADTADVDPERERYRGLSPSAKLVLAAIEVGENSRAEVAELTLLPKRTLDAALCQLRGADLIVRRPDPTDARRTIYVVREGVETPLFGER